MIRSKLKVLSCCTNFPTRNYPTHGLFVRRRLELVSKHVDLRFLNLQPYFPILRPRAPDAPLQSTEFSVDIRRMLYLPGVVKQWDGGWLERSLSKWLDSLPASVIDGAVVDAHFGYPEGVGCYRAARKRKLPLFITVRGLETELMQVPKIKSQMLEAFDYAQGIISVSDSLKKTLEDNGVAQGKIRVIGNGVDSDVYLPGDKAAARERLGIGQEVKLIVAVGNIQRRKGYDILVDALTFRKDSQRVLCAIIGGVNEPSMLELLNSRIKELKLENCIRFLGQQTPDVVVDWLRASDAFVLPTRREGCCNAVLEALSTGAPVITTPAGDNTKFVKDGINGFIVPHDDPQSLAAAIEKSWVHSWDSPTITGSVRPFTWEGTAEKVVEYFFERLF